MPEFEFVGTAYAYCNGKWYTLGDIINEPLGTTITVYSDIQETRFEAGTGAFRADTTAGVNKCRKTAYYVGGETKSFNCSFNMPSSNEDIKFLACHYYGGVDYIYDTKCCFKLRPSAPPTCDQLFYILDDETGLGVQGATVTVKTGAGAVVGSCVTDSGGVCTVTGLTTGNMYSATVTKSGYDTFGPQGFRACITPYWDIYITPIIRYCSQNVYVNTSDGASVRAKIDWGDGSSEYAYTPNTFTHRYEKGKSRTVTVSATGYSPASKSFTTCISQFTLTLQKVPELCHQSFRVIDKNTKTRIEGATVTISTSSCTTNAYGECTIYNLGIGSSYTATIEASGYVTLSDSFTACTEKRLEELTPVEEPAELLFTTPTYQIEAEEVVDLLFTTPTYRIEAVEEPAELLFTTPTYQIEAVEEPAELLFTTPTYRIEAVEEPAELLFTTPTYRIEAVEEPAELLFTTPTYQIEGEEEVRLLFTTDTYQIEGTEEVGFLYATSKKEIKGLSLKYCLSPRISTGVKTPRADEKTPVPRAKCIKEYFEALSEEKKPWWMKAKKQKI